MSVDPGHKEWDDVRCPRCDARDAECVICEGSGVVPPSIASEYKQDPIKVLARKIVDAAEPSPRVTHHGRHVYVPATLIDRLKATYTL